MAELTRDEAIRLLESQSASTTDTSRIGPPVPVSTSTPQTLPSNLTKAQAAQLIEMGPNAGADAFASVVRENTTGALLDSVKSSAPRTGDALTTGQRILQPMTQAISALGTILKRPFVDTSDASTRTLLGERPGVPFDATTGTSFMSRLGDQFAFTRDEQRSLLLRQPNVQDVRFNALGEPVLTVKDAQSGETRDILANPVGLDGGDFAFVAANVPQLIAGFAAARGIALGEATLNKIGTLARYMTQSKDVLPSAARMAVGGRAAQGGVDALVRPAENLPDDSNTLAKRFIEGSLADFVFGSTLGLVAKAGSRVITPVAQRGPIQVDADAAKMLWAREGIAFEFTPGEATGSPLLLRTEAYSAQKPGSAGIFNELQASKRASVTQMQRIMLGTDPSTVPAADLVGQSVLDATASKLRPIDAVIDRTTQRVLDSASSEIQSNVAYATQIPDNVTTSAVGQNLFNAAAQRLESFRAASRDLYNRINSHPAIAGQGRNIDATPLADEARSILNDVAAVQRSVDAPTGLLDASGQALTRTTEQTQPLTAFVDSSAMSRLNQLANAEGGRVSLRDLIELRRDIDDDLFRGSALGGIPERRLGDIRDALTRRVQGGLDELDTTGALRAAWETANSHYADNIQRFKGLDILPIFKNGQQRGALDVYDIVRRAFADPGKWMAYRDFYGNTSPEMNQLRRTYADKIVGRVVGSDTVDAASFGTRLQNAFNSQPEIVEDVFGSRLGELRQLGDAAEGVGRANVDANELANALRSNSLTRAELKTLATAQAVKSDTYRNALLDSMRRGEFEAKPSQVVDNLVFSKDAEPRDLEKLVSLLGDRPEVLDELRQRTLLKLFHESTGGPVGKETLTATGLDTFLGDEMMTKRLNAVLGGDTMTLLTATRNLLRPGAIKETMFRGAGQIAGGTRIAAIEEAIGDIVLDPKSAFGTLGGVAKSWLTALFYKSGPSRAYIGNTVLKTTEDRAAFVNAFVAGTPVIEDGLRLFSDEHMRVISLQLKQAVDEKLRDKR